MNKKMLTIISALFILAMSAAAFAGQEHDPRDNAHAMKDIVEDETAVYGFKPSAEGSLAMYADMDWSDAEAVEAGRQERIAYHESLESMYDILKEMTADGKSTEEIARAVSARRNEIRLEAYADDPENLAKLKARNLEKYGHEEGPLPDELYEQYGSWDVVINKAFSTNSGMDACLGLYDEYYDVYVALGQIDTEEFAADTGNRNHVAMLAMHMAFAIAILMIMADRRYAKKEKNRA